MGMGKEVHVLLVTVTLRSKAMAIKVVVFVFWSVRSLVGTLSGHCLVHQLALQFVFGSVWVLEWALPSHQDVFVAPQFVIWGLLCSLKCRVTLLVPWVGSVRSIRMCLWPLCCERFLCELWVHFPLTEEVWLS